VRLVYDEICEVEVVLEEGLGHHSGLERRHDHIERACRERRGNEKRTAEKMREVDSERRDGKR